MVDKFFVMGPIGMSLFCFFPSIFLSSNYYLIQNSQAVKKSVALRKAMVKKDVKSKVAAKKWL